MSKPTNLYRHFDKSGTLLYVGISLSAVGRLKEHNDSAHWAAQIANMTIETLPTRAEAEEAEQNAIRAENPLHNIRRYKKPKLKKAALDYIEIPHITFENGKEVRRMMRIPAAQWDAAIAKSRAKMGGVV